MRDRITQLISLASIAISLSSCASAMLRANVDSSASPKASVETEYILAPGNKGVHPNDLQFLEYAGYINDIMQNNGFVRADSGANAQAVVFLSYGIGRPPTRVYSHSLPVYGQMGISSSVSTGMINPFGNAATHSGSTTHLPSYGITGHNNHVGTNTTYTRYLILDAYEANEFWKSKKMVEIWKTTVVSTGRSNDLRLVFPIMAAAMEPYIGSNTGQTLSVVISKDSPALQQLLRDNGKEPAAK